MRRKPKYRRHSSRDLGFVERDGKRIYFPGPYRSPESTRAYRAWLRTNGYDLNENEPVQRASVGDLVVGYVTHAERFYPGGHQSENANIRAAMQRLVGKYGALPLEEFTPGKLKALQESLAKVGLARGYVNSIVRRIKRMFRWGVVEEIVRPELYQALAAVPGLRKGRSTARETAPRRPVAWEHVRPVLSELSSHVALMVRIHWLTGVRSQSLCAAKGEQFDRTKSPWEWRPRHKGEHLDRDLVVFVGPQAQHYLTPLLNTKHPGEYLFRPLHNKTGRPARGFKGFYQPQAYARAITKAIKRVNRQRAKDGEAPIPLWTPHQLRHAKATLVRAKYGVEAAQAALGHQRLSTAEIYAQRQHDAARQAAQEMG